MKLAHPLPDTEMLRIDPYADYPPFSLSPHIFSKQKNINKEDISISLRISGKPFYRRLELTIRNPDGHPLIVRMIILATFILFNFN